MRDINAVMTSTFVIGESMILAKKVRDVAKFRGDLSAKLQLQRNEMVMTGAESILRMNVAKAELQKTVSHYTIEANRLRIVAEKEKKDIENNITVAGAKWELEVWQHGANLLAAIGGGTMVPRTQGSDGPSDFQTAIGGALAVAGAISVFSDWT